MAHEIKSLPKSEVEIKITITPDELAKYEERAIHDLGQNAKIKGFRPGKVPADVLRKHIGENAIKYHMQDLAIQKTYTDVVIKEKIAVVSRPTVKIDKDDDTGLTYVATVAVMPEVTVKDYQSIKVKKEEAKVTKKDVDAVVDDLKKYIATYKDVDRAAKKGDRAELAFEGFDKEGKSLEGTKSQHHPVILGEGSLIPGFEENVIGMKVGDKKEFDITFPDEYHNEEFKGKEVTFKIELQRLEEPEAAELNEEAIEKITGQKQKPEDFLKKIESDLQARKEQEVAQKQENEYLEELLKKTKVDLPKSLLDEEVHYIIHEVQQNVEQKGAKWDEFLAQSGMTHEDLHKKYEPEAERRLKIRLALNHLIKEEKIEVKEAEVKKELEAAQQYYKDANVAELEAQIKNRLALRQLFDKVLG